MPERRKLQTAQTVVLSPISLYSLQLKTLMDYLAYSMRLADLPTYERADILPALLDDVDVKALAITIELSVSSSAICRMLADLRS
jgi:hypothetical protein